MASRRTYLVGSLPGSVMLELRPMRLLPGMGPTGRLRIESGIMRFDVDLDLDQGAPTISLALVVWTLGCRVSLSLFGYWYISIIGLF